MTASERAMARSDNKKLSLIDAAAQVLDDCTRPISTREMIELITDRGLWSSPNGKTPANTLYSAILREIKTKGDESRFVKAERGKFALNAADEKEG